jgi:hypothetical protein
MRDGRCGRGGNPGNAAAVRPDPVGSTPFMTVGEEGDLRARIDLLGREIYGEDFEKFLLTPRRSLDWKTPAVLLERGENERVMQILIRAANGDFG